MTELADTGTAARLPRGGSQWLERTLAGLSGSLEGSLFAEQAARRPGFLQRLDPRVKILITLAFLLAVGLSRRLTVILALYAVLLLLARLSALPLGFLIKRVWLFMPFFTALVVVPALFITPGPVLVSLPLGAAVTRTGAAAALFLLLRVGVSVSAAVVLVLTTPWNSLLKALGVLRVPDVLLLILGMTYRYIFLLLHEAGDLFLARKSRLLRQPSGKEGRDLAASGAGVLLSRNLQMSEEVSLAMQSRGFRGVPRTMDPFRLAARDWAFGAGALLVCAAAAWLGR